MSDVPFDVVVAGAGPVGLAFALFLRERGVPAARIAIVDARTRESAADDERMIAISHGSATLLARLGAWDAAEPHATAIHAIHVSHRGHFGRTLIDRDDHGVDALGHVVRHGALTTALDGALARRGVAVRRPVRAVSVVARDAEVDGGVDVTLVDERGEREVVTARHVVHAEGGLFDGQSRRAIHRDYVQGAVTAFVTTRESPDPALATTAFERFTDAGPIALLPARRDVDGDGAGSAGYALVWCGTPADTAARAAWGDAVFLDALYAAFGDRLGAFATAGPRRAFPLGLNAVDRPARALSEHAVAFAIGNAAQTLHPVAGQGLNLGLRDAYALASLLAAQAFVPASPASELVARFVASRRADRAATVDLTDFMPRVFASPRAAVALGRGLALALLDVAPPLAGLFARQMMDGRR